MSIPPPLKTFPMDSCVDNTSPFGRCTACDNNKNNNSHNSYINNNTPSV